nr:DUF6575 domain-containing protein [uncultured Psychroserpens sp.]
MKRKLLIDRILVYNDFPELFLALDNSGTKYLCLLTTISNDDYRYHCVAVSQNRLYKFLNGKTDLRYIFLNPELPEWWETKDTSEKEFEIKFFTNSGLEEEFLPEEDCFFIEEQNEDVIREEVVENNNVVVHLSLSDDENKKSIPIDDLGDFAKLYQSLVENAYKKSILSSELDLKRSYITQANYQLNAFASSPGSFVLHLKSNSNKDLFGNSLIEEGLRRIDDIISNPENEKELIEALRSVKGHTISNYQKILDKVISEDITFKYKWLSPNSPVIHTRTINQNYARKVKDILNQKEELVEEIKEFIGFVKQADVERGSWRITNEEDNKDYTGESQGHLLDGITLETVRYKFICEEFIESMKVTEKEKVKYRLKFVNRAE